MHTIQYPRGCNCIEWMIFEVALSTQCFLLIHPSPLNSPSLLICHTHIHVHIHTYTFACTCTYIYRHRHLSPAANRGVRTDRRAPPQGGRPDRRRYLRECGDPRLSYAGARAIRKRQVRGETSDLLGRSKRCINSTRLISVVSTQVNVRY